MDGPALTDALLRLVAHGLQVRAGLMGLRTRCCSTSPRMQHSCQASYDYLSAQTSCPCELCLDFGFYIQVLP